MTPVAIPSSLVHGIRADPLHWVDCWNFALSGARTAVEVVAMLERTPSLRDTPMDVLRGHPEEFPATFLSPFASLVFQGAMLRAGMKIGYGVAPFETRWFSETDEQRTLSNSERELFFEETRRVTAPDAPSRLTCIWAAEDTTAGRNYVQRIMGPHSFLLEIQLVFALRVARCDAHWLDQWASDPAVAAGYWRGEPFDDQPLWEYLIDGSVRATNDADIARVKDWAWSNIPSDLRSGPGSE